VQPLGSVPASAPDDRAGRAAPKPAPSPHAAQLERIRQSILDRYPRDKTAHISLLERAFHDAERLHQGQFRKSGEPYILHPYRVALTAAEAGLDLETVIIALLHDVIEDTEITKEEVTAQYGEWLADVVDGLTKASALDAGTRLQRNVATYRKLIHSTLKDLRTVQVKLFDRLDNLRDLGFLERARQRRICLETLNVYVPMAQRLGMLDIADELTALSFRYLYPRRFSQTLAWLKRRVQEEQQKTQTLRMLIESILAEVPLKGAKVRPIQVRISDFLHTSALPPTALTGFTVVVPQDRECYQALGAVHMKSRVVPGSIKDFISNPQPNGYRALQSQIFLGGEAMTLVVCSEAMEALNRSGILISWDGSQEELRRYYGSYLELLDHADGNELRMEDVLRHAQLETLQVFTPKGKLLSFPPGATVIDFAFAIHSDLGLHCSGARMGGRLVTPFDELQDGEVVSVLTDPNASPAPNWVDHVRTTRAQVALRRYLNAQAHLRAEELGRALFVAEAKRLGEDPDTLAQERLQRALTHEGWTLEHLYQLVGMRKLPLRQFLLQHGVISQQAADRVQSQEQGLLQRFIAPIFTNPFSSAEAPVLRVPEGGDAFIALSPCCAPLPGDPIVGVQIDHGLAVHRVNCPRLKDVPAEDLTPLAWDTGREKVPYALEILMRDRAGMVYRITKIMSDLNVSIHDLNLERSADGNTALLRVLLEPIEPRTYQKIVPRLRGIREIESIVQVYDPRTRPADARARR
jgi:GTP diphosphokinase / guanosine-3',5'-bis(diphosphate) 3'-diphosphatase